MSFKVFSIFSSGGHFVQQSGTILAILVEGHPRNISVKFFLKSFLWSRMRCNLKVFLFLALAAILFSRTFKQRWQMVSQGTFL